MYIKVSLKIVRNELGLVQIVEALSDTWQYLTAVAFDLGDDTHHAGLLHITENGIEAHHSALSDFPVVLYVQHLEPSGKLEEIIHGLFCPRTTQYTSIWKKTFSGSVWLSI